MAETLIRCNQQKPATGGFFFVRGFDQAFRIGAAATAHPVAPDIPLTYNAPEAQ